MAREGREAAERLEADHAKGPRLAQTTDDFFAEPFFLLWRSDTTLTKGTQMGDVPRRLALPARRREHGRTNCGKKREERDKTKNCMRAQAREKRCMH
eukprot:3597749-Pyramimonas_sp.AAC.1